MLALRLSRALPRALPSPLSQQHRALHASSPAPSARPIEQVTIFGAGLMGAGIAQVAAASGLKVTMTDVSDGALENGRNIITKSLTRIARKKSPDDAAAQRSFVDSVFANLSTTTSAPDAVSSADLVIEAIVEHLGTKQELFRRLDDVAPKEAIFASNTSSLSIKRIGETCSDARRKRFAGFHAFNPVPQMKLVEVISTDQTLPEVTTALLDLCKRMKKVPVQCSDTPGFIVNRLLVPYLLEAIRMVERGEATPEDIDTAMKLGAGVPMGPLELSDFVGLDTLSHIASGWRAERVSTGEIDAKQVEEVALLEKLVGEGHKGRKSGKGLFDYSDK